MNYSSESIVAFELLESFISHKGDKHIPTLFSALALFIKKNGPVMEDVHKRLQILQATPFGQIQKEIMEKSLRSDLADAKKGMYMYNVVYHVFQNRLIMLTSNYTARRYLYDEFGIRTASALYEHDFSLIFSATYGKLLERLKLIEEKLRVIRDCLQKQITLLEMLESDQVPYLQGLKERDQIRDLFLKERETFHEIALLSNMAENESNELLAVVQTHVLRLRQSLMAHVGIIKGNIGKDLAESRSKSEKAIVVFAFLLQFVVVVKSIKQILGIKAFKFLRSSGEKYLRELEAGSKQSLVALEKDDHRTIERFLASLDHIPQLL